MSSLIEVDNLIKYFGAEKTLNEISFILNTHQKMGIVGANGVGKSTLLRIIAGELDFDSGEIHLRKGVSIGYLPQAIQDTDQTIGQLLEKASSYLNGLSEKMRLLETKMGKSNPEELSGILNEYSTVTQEFEQRGGYDLEFSSKRILEGLEINDIENSRSVSTLSGGEKSRLSLACVLIGNPDLLLLDEPTNHLDFSLSKWLEEFLNDFRGSFIVISHDRYFLDNIVNVIVEIDEYDRRNKIYLGNYKNYLALKTQELTQWQDGYDREQKELKELTISLRNKAWNVGHYRAASDNDKVIHNFFGEKVQQTVSRNIRNIQERISKIHENPIPKPPEPLEFKPIFKPLAVEFSDEVVFIENISKKYSGNFIFRNVSFSVIKNDRIALIGSNGAGKTTILRIIANLIPPDSGKVFLNGGARIGYLDQETDSLNSSNTVFEVYREDITGNDDDLKSDLLRFGLFTREDLDKLVNNISIGQKRKLQIAKLIASRANILLLDEPTNHVSFNVLEEFEKAILTFPGPVIAVSHDRRFLKKFSTKTFLLDNNGLTQFDISQT